MAATKTLADTQDQGSPSPAAVKQPEKPEKATGPQRVARSAESSAAPPPNGASSPMRSAALLTNDNHSLGAVPRARTMRNLQRSIGNARISNLIGNTIQTKLSVGAADDPQEREADQVAESVTSGRKSEPSLARQIVMKYSLARLPNARPEKRVNEPPAQSSIPSTGENESPAASPIQRAGASEANDEDVDGKMENRITSPGSGQALPEGVQREMEAGMSADFSNVRVHDTATDRVDAGRLSAKAFTHGSDIWLGPGQSANDRKLMAHELTHVVQQGGGKVRRNPSAQPDRGTSNDERIARQSDDSSSASPENGEAETVTAEPQTDSAAGGADMSRPDEESPDMQAESPEPTGGASEEDITPSAAPDEKAAAAGDATAPAISEGEAHQPGSSNAAAGTAEAVSSEASANTAVSAPEQEQPENGGRGALSTTEATAATQPPAQSSESSETAASPAGATTAPSESADSESPVQMGSPSAQSANEPEATATPEAGAPREAPQQPEAVADAGSVPETAVGPMAQGEGGAVETAERAPAAGQNQESPVATAAPATDAAEGTAELTEEVTAPEGAAAGAATGGSETVTEEASGEESAPAPSAETASAGANAGAQANPVASLINVRTQSLEAEAEATAMRVMGGQSARVEQRAEAPEVQFDLWDDVKSVAGRGADWVSENVAGPIRNLAAQASAGINWWGGHITTAWHETEFTAWDIVQLPAFVLRFNRNLRQHAMGEVIADERRQRMAAMAQAGHPVSEADLEPSFLENLNDVTERVESAGESVFGVQREILEGAVLGDFKENPTIWNTIGQVAVGFIPYAGQVADIRDLIAGIEKLKKSGWKDPWEWFNIVLIGIGFIPGVGDAIKAVGRGLKGTIKKAVGALSKRARKIWGAITRRLPGLIADARAFGRRLIDGAVATGRKLLESGRALGRKVLEVAKGALQRGRDLIARAGKRIAGLAKSALDRARRALGQVRDLIGRAGRAISGTISRIVDGARNLINRGLAGIRQAVERGRAIAGRIARQLADAMRRAADFARETVRQMVQRGRALLQRARQRAAQLVRQAIEKGKRLALRAYSTVRGIISRGLQWVGRIAIPWVKGKLGGIKNRILKFFKDKWEALKKKLKPRRVTIPNDPNRLHHIFGQPKHNWHKTGLTQAENAALIERIANDSANHVGSRTIPTGQIHTFSAVQNGNTIEVKVFESLTGEQMITDAWVK